MIEFLCKLWPYLAGGLIGWLLAGWLARRLRNAEPPVEKIIEKEIEVEKIVDNPEHLALISRLEGENKEIETLRTQVKGFESSSSQIREVEKTVEVDNPAHLSRIRELETEVNRLKQGQGSSVATTTQIDLQAARAAGISIKSENDFTAVEGIGPKINDLIHDDGISSFAQLADTDVSRLQSTLDKAGPNYAMANPGTWPDQAHLAANNRWSALKALQDVLDGGVYPDTSSKPMNVIDTTDTDQNSVTFTEVNLDVAKAAGFTFKKTVKGQNDFTVVEGIGPKINELIHNADIHSYGELAQTAVSSLQTILDDAGPRYKLARPDTWPKQAALAASNKWKELKVLQDELDGGV